MNAQTSKNETFTTGAVRGTGCAGSNKAVFPIRIDLLFGNAEAVRRISEAFGEGSAKYGDNNWKKGIPESNLLNHALAHILAHFEGDATEDHMAHATWNLLSVMWQQAHKPAMLDVTGMIPGARGYDLLQRINGDCELVERASLNLSPTEVHSIITGNAFDREA